MLHVLLRTPAISSEHVHAHYLLLYACLTHRTDALVPLFALLGSALRSLIHAAIRLNDAAPLSSVTRLYEEAARLFGTRLRKYCPAFLSTILECLRVFALAGEQRHELYVSAAALFALCTSKEQQHLYATLDEGGRDTYRLAYDHYEKNNKFVGKV